MHVLKVLFRIAPALFIEGGRNLRVQIPDDLSTWDLSGEAADSSRST